MISVVIPTLNEATRLPTLLRRLAASSTPHEVIVADGGSTDGTARLAEMSGASLIEGARGRGPQLAAGAAAARGDILWFLHADTTLPAADPLAAIARALDTEETIEGGNFRLLFDGNTEFCRWLDGFYERLRARGLYYGDSGVFIRRAVFDGIGGIGPLALMEDYDLVRRLEARGRTIQIRDPALTTSARRFEGRRKPAIVAGWIAIHLLFHLGVPTGWLARLYDSARSRRRPGHRAASFSAQS